MTMTKMNYDELNNAYDALKHAYNELNIVATNIATMKYVVDDIENVTLYDAECDETFKLIDVLNQLNDVLCKNASNMHYNAVHRYAVYDEIFHHTIASYDDVNDAMQHCIDVNAELGDECIVIDTTTAEIIDEL